MSLKLIFDAHLLQCRFRRKTVVVQFAVDSSAVDAREVEDAKEERMNSGYGIGNDELENIYLPLKMAQ